MEIITKSKKNKDNARNLKEIYRKSKKNKRQSKNIKRKSKVWIVIGFQKNAFINF